jgi:proline racemase
MTDDGMMESHEIQRSPFGSGYVSVDVADLHTDSGYQQPVSKQMVEKLASEFKLDLVGTIQVNYRDGVLWIVDGKHRVEAAKIVGITRLVALVTHSSREGEIAAFLSLNSRGPRA